ncbi:lysozyme inhibitor LprI family protein [Fundidesulfovibrio magnetotacticus]|uniref:lysozyme inhibitor LprI family protein n=1 Tax=Fundidesulfovibrio magnetotacticus TaxID=2730080 RepID=UPI001565D7EF|nr:lysozyme inhibitor LprI family protein [Fundidesulfovibrio magnetotacticus]
MRAFPALLLLLALFSGPTLAQDCDKASSVPDMTECARLRLRAAERELGAVYGDLLDSEDKDLAQAVRAAQEAWMRWREAEGKLAASGVTDPGVAQLERTRQEARMTEERLMDLKALRGR